MKIAIVTDSTSDLSEEIAKQYGITIVPLNVHFGLETYQDGITIKSDEFYERLISGSELPTTSAPSPGLFTQTYEKLSESHDGIISIHVSSKLSATFSAALEGSNGIKIPVQVIDSETSSAALSLIVIGVAEAVKSNINMDKAKSISESLIKRTKIFFTLDTLEYLIKGGRIGKALGLIGSLLKMKPILGVDEGEVISVEKIRSKKKAYERMHELAVEHEGYLQGATIYSTDDSQSKILAESLKSICESDILSLRLGPVVGTYGGPDVVGFAVVLPNEADGN